MLIIYSHTLLFTAGVLLAILLFGSTVLVLSSIAITALGAVLLANVPAVITPNTTYTTIPNVTSSHPIFQA